MTQDQEKEFENSMESTTGATPGVEQLRLHETDTGSAQVQVACLTERINGLSGHFTTHQRDFNSRQGLLRMVGRRRRLLEYLKRHDERTNRTLLDVLNLRK